MRFLALIVCAVLLAACSSGGERAASSDRPSNSKAPNGPVPVWWEAYKDSEGYGYLYFEPKTDHPGRVSHTEPLVMEKNPDSLGAAADLNLDFAKKDGRLFGIEFESAPDMYPKEIDARWNEGEMLAALARPKRNGNEVDVALSAVPPVKEIPVKAGESVPWLRVGLDAHDRVVSLTFVGAKGRDLLPRSMKNVAPSAVNAPSAKSAIVDFLESSGAGFRFRGGHVFCAVDLLGESRRSNPRQIFAWYVCTEWASKNGGAVSGSAISAPASFKIDAEGNVIKHDQPGDGSLYERDIKRIFPDKLESMVLSPEIDICSLVLRSKERARAYFKWPNATVSDGRACHGQSH